LITPMVELYMLWMGGYHNSHRGVSVRNLHTSGWTGSGFGTRDYWFSWGKALEGYPVPILPIFSEFRSYYSRANGEGRRFEEGLD